MFLASRGLRDLDFGSEPIGRPRLAHALRRQAREVWLYSLACATTITALTTVL